MSTGLSLHLTRLSRGTKTKNGAASRFSVVVFPGRWSREIPSKETQRSISALAPTSPGPLRPDASSSSLRRNEHDARHGGSNGCPSWPVAGRHYDLQRESGGWSRSIVTMSRGNMTEELVQRCDYDGHPGCVSLEAPPSTRTIRPPRTPLEPTFQNDKSLIDTQSDSLCTSEPRGSRTLSQPLRRTYATGKISIAFCCSSTVFTSGSCPASRRVSWASSLRMSTASAVEKDKSIPLCDYKIHPAEAPSPGTVALAFLNAAQPRILRHAHHMSFARPPAPRSLPRRLRVRLFRFRVHLRASLRRPHGANPTRLRREFRHSRVPATNPAVLTAGISRAGRACAPVAAARGADRFEHERQREPAHSRFPVRVNDRQATGDTPQSRPRCHGQKHAQSMAL